MKKMLIIGGAGFIGVNTARYFASRKWHVTVLDDLSRKGTKKNLAWLERDYPKNIRFVKADIVSDLSILGRQVGLHEVVIHLAAQVAVTTSINQPRKDFLVNVVGTFNVLEAVRLSKNRPILLYSSTNKVYGSLPNLPVVAYKTRYVFKDKNKNKHGIDENSPIDFHSPYGCSKGAADHYVVDYSRIYGLKTVVFRQSCIYGEYQFGVEDQGWVAWFTIASLLKKKLTLYGNGKQVRDLLYVGDLVSLYEKAIHNIDKVNGQAFNIGGGPKNTLSLIELIESLRKDHKLETSVIHLSVRAGDQPIFVADTRKILKILGWSPRTTISEGLSKLVAWTRDHQKDVEGLQ